MDAATRDLYERVDRLSGSGYWPADTPLVPWGEVAMFGGVPMGGILSTLITEWSTRAVEGKATEAKLTLRMNQDHVKLEWDDNASPLESSTFDLNLLGLAARLGWQIATSRRMNLKWNHIEIVLPAADKRVSPALQRAA
jgi:hypothetical protein